MYSLEFFQHGWLHSALPSFPQQDWPCIVQNTWTVWSPAEHNNASDTCLWEKGHHEHLYSHGSILNLFPLHFQFVLTSIDVRQRQITATYYHQASVSPSVCQILPITVWLQSKAISLSKWQPDCLSFSNTSPFHTVVQFTIRFLGAFLFN